jgi:hypothetical protein
MLFFPLTCLTAGPINVPSIIPNYTANGADLAGLLVTVTWDFGPLTTDPGIHSFTYTWAATGLVSGGVQAPVHPSFLVIGLSGNSATAAWMFNGLYADPVLSVMLDGTAAGILFDRAVPSPGTPGTGTGDDAIALFSSLSGIAATYSDPVGVAGAAPVGDLYSRLRFDFGTVGTDLPFSFKQAVVLATPEPATSVVTFLGVGMLATCLRRRKTRKDGRLERSFSLVGPPAA